MPWIIHPHDENSYVVRFSGPAISPRPCTVPLSLATAEWYCRLLNQHDPGADEWRERERRARLKGPVRLPVSRQDD